MVSEYAQKKLTTQPQGKLNFNLSLIFKLIVFKYLSMLDQEMKILKQQGQHIF